MRIKCTKCEKRKDESKFYKTGNKKNGYRSECKECSKDSTKQYRARQKAKAKK